MKGWSCVEPCASAWNPWPGVTPGANVINIRIFVFRLFFYRVLHYIYETQGTVLYFTKIHQRSLYLKCFTNFYNIDAL